MIFLTDHFYNWHPGSRCDLQPADIKSRWRHNWKLAQVVNSYLVCDPTVRQPGFDLPRQHWSLLNRFRTEQGHCGPAEGNADLQCPCGETQSMSHSVKSCPLTKLNVGLSRLHSADEDAVSWPTNYGLWHARRRCLHQARLAGRDIMFLSVHPFVRLLPNLWAWYFENENLFWCRLAEVVHGSRAWNDQLWGQEVKGQGHNRRKIYLEAWRRHHSRPLGSSNFSSFLWACCSHYTT